MANKQPLGPRTRKIYHGAKFVTLTIMKFSYWDFLCNRSWQIHEE